MSPSDFTFKLTVPNDPEGASVVAAVAAHAVQYTNINATPGAAFVERVRGFASRMMKGSDGAQCLVVFAAAGGQLTVTMGSESVSEPLPS
jgi:hypothetical protein